jgi:hypothetical protein
MWGTRTILVSSTEYARSGYEGVMAAVDLTFPHTWAAEILPQRPLILPKRQFVYPRQAEEVERGAMEVLVRPAVGEPFLATCALGFADPAAPSGVWSCPHPDWLCAVSGGYVYMIDTTAPERFTQVEYRPVLEIRALLEQQLLLFAGHHSLLAWGTEGMAWQTVRLSSEGVTITGVEADALHGVGWDLRSDSDVPFVIDLRTGERI